MEPPVIIGAAFGSFLTWCICKNLYEKKRRTYVREITESTNYSNEIRERHYAVTVMTYRSVLELIEAGDFESAKRRLSNSVADFYRIKTKSRQEMGSLGIQPSGQDWTGNELKEIERDAKRFEILRVALARRKDEPAT